LGDVFHFRKPDPETITSVIKFFARLKEDYFIDFTFLRGNHDTASKSDNGSFTTILDVLSVYGKVITETTSIRNNLFIPHYESDSIIKEHLRYAKPDQFVFGHFGFYGCLNTAGDNDFDLLERDFTNQTFLGHIHKPMDSGNVHIVGTPYSTSFQEVDNNHRYAVIYKDNTFEYKPIESGLRYLSFDLNSLEANKEFINDTRFTTLLRVFLNQLTDKNSIDLRKDIMSSYNIKYVELKYLPLIDEHSAKSNFRPRSMVFELDDAFIDSYIEDCKSTIPKEKLLEGLRTLKQD
jgi:DNA repair exonuclease SbcCD nuclease subunit